MKFLKLIYISIILTLIMTIQAVAAPYVTYKLNYDAKTHIYTEEIVYLKVNGEELTNLPMSPVIMNGNTLVPAREVFEKLGARVAWKEKEQEVDVLYNNTFVVMHINDTNALVAGRNLVMNVAPKIINNKTMIPLRFVSEAVGLEVGWDKNTRTATVDEPKPIITTEETTIITTQEQPVINETTTVAKIEATTEASTENCEIISTGSNNKTSITGVLVPTGNSNSFVISASSVLSDIKVYPEKKGKLTIDILNAENKLNQNSYSVTHPYVTAIVASQFQRSPEFITRIVLSIDESSKYNVNFSDDKTSIVIAFEQNAINKIEASAGSDKDIIKITGASAPSVKMSRSSDGSKIIADLPYSRLNTKIDTIQVGNLVDTVTYSQFSLTTVRVVLNLKNTECGYKTSTSGNSVSITVGEDIILEEVTAKVGYNKDTHTITLPKGNMNFKVSSISHNDNYLSKNYTLVFPGNCSSAFGEGKIDINDDYLNGYTITSTDLNTTISISEKKILAYDVTSDDNFIYIKAMLPKEKYKNIVVLDAGHGGSAPGAVDNGLYEKNLTLDIVNKTIALFEQDNNMKVYATRTTDVNPSFDDRTNLANEVGDVFISVHINSGGNATAANGTEVYHYNGKSSPTGLSSKILAEKMQSKLLSYLNSTDRKVKTESFIVIRQTTIPAVLCEIGFITNQAEAAKMATDSYRQQAARAIYEGCKELFEVYPNR